MPALACSLRAIGLAVLAAVFAPFNRRSKARCERWRSVSRHAAMKPCVWVKCRRGLGIARGGSPPLPEFQASDANRSTASTMLASADCIAHLDSVSILSRMIATKPPLLGDMTKANWLSSHVLGERPMAISQHRKFACVTFGAALTISLTAACSSSSSDGADKAKSGPYQVTGMFARSGLLEAVGTNCLAALRVAVDTVNRSGGIGGRQVELSVVDSKGDPAQAVAAAQKALTGSQKPDLFIPGCTSVEAVPVAPILTEFQVLSLSSAIDPSLNDPQKYPDHFQTGVSLTSLIATVVTRLTRDHISKVGLVVPDTQLGHSSQKEYAKQLSSAGIGLETVQVPGDATDATSQLDKLRAKAPDALVVGINGPAVVPVLKARTKLKWKVRLYGDTNTSANDLTSLVQPADLENSLMEYLPEELKGDPLSRSSAVTLLKNGLLSRLGGNILFGLPTYSAVFNTLLIAQAAAKIAKSTATQDMVKALESLNQTPTDYIGPDSIGFTSSRHSVQWPVDHLVFAPAGSRSNLVVDSAPVGS